MTAKETWTFFSLFPLMIGDLIPRGCVIWSIFIKLSEIVDVCLSSRFSERNIQFLETLVTQFNSLYQLHFKKDLKPKFHFLVHYPTIIFQSGPPKYLWNFRNEGKLREYKIYARSTTSRKNIAKSLSIKSMLGFANRILSNRGLKADVVYPTKIEQVVNTHKKFYFENVLDWKNINPIQSNSLKAIELKGTAFKVNHLVCNFTQDKINIYRIVDILKYNETVVLVSLQFGVSEYDEHLQSYILGDTISSYELININSIQSYPSNSHLMANGKFAIKFRPI